MEKNDFTVSEIQKIANVLNVRVPIFFNKIIVEIQKKRNLYDRKICNNYRRYVFC